MTVSGVPPYSRSPVWATVPPRLCGHRLEAVADAEGRDAGLEQRRVDLRGARRVDARRPAGQHDRRRLAGQHLLDRHVGRDDLGVDAGLADPPGDQLRVLGAEVDDEDGREVHQRSVPTPADDQVDPLELLEVAVAGLGHRAAQRAEEVGAAVGGLGRAEQHLLAASRRGATGADAPPRGSRGWRPTESHQTPPPGASRGDPQRLAELDGVGAAGQRPGDGAAGLDPAVGDDVHVPAAGLVEVVAAGGGGVGDRAGQRHPDAHDGVGGGPAVGADADDHAGRAGAHQVQRGLVVRRAADDHRDVEVGDELLEVERLALGGDVLGGDDRALDDQQVDAGVEDRRGQLQRCAAARRGRPSVTPASRISLIRSADQVRLDRLGVDLLQQRHRRAPPAPAPSRSLPVDRRRVLVAGPQALGVEHAEAAGLADGDRRRRADDGVGRAGDQRDARTGRRRSARRSRRRRRRGCAGTGRSRPRRGRSRGGRTG